MTAEVFPFPAAAPFKSKLLRGSEEYSFEAILAANEKQIISGLLGPGETGLVYGESGSGKSFVMLDLAAHLALGRDWHGRRVKQTGCIYCCLEGEGGMMKRVLALKHHLGCELGPLFKVLKVPMSLVRDKAGDEGVQTLIDAIHEMRLVHDADNVVVIVDTYARAIAGDEENQAHDTMHFIEHRMQPVIRKTEASMLVVHHPNRNGQARGSTALVAASDFVIRIRRLDAAKREAWIEKVKDGDDNIPLFHFQLEKVVLGGNGEGEMIDSCVIRVDSKADRARTLAAIEAVRAVIVNTGGEGLSLKRRTEHNVAKVAHRSYPDIDLADLERAATMLEGTNAIGAEVYKDEKGRKKQRLILIAHSPRG